MISPKTLLLFFIRCDIFFPLLILLSCIVYSCKNKKDKLPADMLYLRGSHDHKLRLACRYGHTRSIALYLKKGANINSASKHSRMTGLMDAVWHQHLEGTTLLVRCNADVTIQNKHKNNALHLVRISYCKIDMNMPHEKRHMYIREFHACRPINN